MNRDEILKMEVGQKLDSLIAEKVMGWKRAHMDYAFWQPTAAEVLLRYCSPELKPYENAEINYFQPFHPSYDISAAWEVFLEMCKYGIAMISNGDGDSCDVDIVVDLTSKYNAVAVSSETFPLAICRAALLAVMDTND